MEETYIELIFKTDNINNIKLSPHFNNNDYKNNSCKIKYLKEEMYFKIQDEKQEFTLKNVINFMKLWILNNRAKVNNIYSHLDDKITASIKLIVNKNVYFEYDMKNNSKSEINAQDIELLIGMLKDIINVQNIE